MDVVLDSPFEFGVTKPIVTKYITRYRYYICNFILNQEMTIIIDYFSDAPAPIYKSIIKVSGEQYKSWGSDDSYIEDIILTEIDNVRNGTSSNVTIIDV